MWVIDTSSRILSNSQILRTFWMKMISLYNRCHPEWSVVWEKIRLNNYRIVLFLLWCPFVLHPATTRWSSQYGVSHLPPKRLRFPIIIRRWLKMNRSFRIAFTQKNILTLIPFFFVVDITIDHGHGIHFFFRYSLDIYLYVWLYTKVCVCVRVFIYICNKRIYLSLPIHLCSPSLAANVVGLRPSTLMRELDCWNRYHRRTNIAIRNGWPLIPALSTVHIQVFVNEAIRQPREGRGKLCCETKM